MKLKRKTNNKFIMKEISMKPNCGE